MKINQMRYFVKIAEFKTFHRAAEELCIAQPALTRQIIQLEEELGLQVFDRLPRGVQLTPSGETFLIGAKKILADIEDLVNQTRQDIVDPVGTLLVAYEDSVAQNPIIAKGLQLIGVAHPRVTVKLMPLSERHQMERLSNREIDIGFAYDSCGEFAQSPDLSCHVLEKEPLMLALPSDHRLAKRGTIMGSDLADEPFVMIAKDKAPKQGYEHLMRACHNAGMSPRIVQEVPNIDGLLNLVSVGLGLTLCARGVRNHLPNNVVMRHVEGLDIDFSFTMIWRRRSQSATARRFVEIVKSIQADKVAVEDRSSASQAAKAAHAVAMKPQRAPTVNDNVFRTSHDLLAARI